MGEILIFEGFDNIPGMFDTSGTEARNQRLNTARVRQMAAQKQAARLEAGKKVAAQRQGVMDINTPLTALMDDSYGDDYEGGQSYLPGYMGGGYGDIIVAGIDGLPDDFDLFGGVSRGGFRGGFAGNTISDLVAGGVDGIFKARHWWNENTGRKILREGVFRHGQNNRGWARRRTRGFNTVANARGSSFDYHNTTRSTDYLITVTTADFNAGNFKEHKWNGKLQPTLKPDVVSRLARSTTPLHMELPVYPWMQIMQYRKLNGLPSQPQDLEPRAVTEAVSWGEMSASEMYNWARKNIPDIAGKISSGIQLAPEFISSSVTSLVTSFLPSGGSTPSTTTEDTSMTTTDTDTKRPFTILGMPWWLPVSIGGVVAVVTILMWRRT